MTVYLILAAFALISAILEAYVPKGKYNRKILNFTWLIFLLIIGLRYHHGDYGGYEAAYNMDEDITGDRGYFYLQFFFHKVHFEFYVFIFLISLFGLSCFRKIFSLSPWPAFCLAVILGKIFTVYAMSGVRQFIGIALCWWALYFLLVKGRTLLFLCLVLLAFTIHGSALIFLPVVFFKNFKFSYIRVVMIVILALLIANLSNALWKDPDQNNMLISRMAAYVNNNEDYGSMNAMNYIENSVILLLAFIVRKKVANKVPFYDFFLYLYVIYFVFLLAGGEYGIVKRLRDYYVIAYAFICPCFMFLFKSRHLKRMTYMVFVIYFIFLMFRSFAVYDAPFTPGTESLMIPYHSIFSYSEELF